MWNWYGQFYFLIFLAKIRSEDSISIPIHPGLIYFWIWLFGGTANQGGEEAESGEGKAVMSNLCLISHRWYDVEKFTVSGNSNLNFKFFTGTAKSFVLKRWKKNIEAKAN